MKSKLHILCIKNQRLCWVDQQLQPFDTSMENHGQSVPILERHMFLITPQSLYIEEKMLFTLCTPGKGID